MTSQWPLTDDDRRWDKEATELRHTGLSFVRASADKWQQSIAAFLSILGTVAFITGPSSLDEIPGGSVRIAVGLLILGAGVLGVVAFFLASLAAQGSPRWGGYVGGAKLKGWYQTQTRIAVQYLWISRALAVSSVACVFVAAALSWFSSA
jgi:hypothetical protein